MIKRIVSSAVLMCRVNRGGIKNTSQIKALSAAEIKTGRISNIIANKETVSKSIKATTWYPNAGDKPKQTAETSTTVVIEYRYCFVLFNRSNPENFMLHQI
jgi:hypothetical protein